MWIDVITAIVSLILILIFAYFIVFVLELAGLYKPNTNAIIHRYELGMGGSEGVSSPMTI